LESKIDEFLIIIGAGQETTANALALAILELGQNPHALERLNEEVRNVLGIKPMVSGDDLSKLDYTSCVLKEAMRKWPPITGLFRKNDKEISINGHVIPKETTIQV
jgi:cytochrome P450